MDTFRWIATVVSMILGLGVARLLTAGVAVFRARRVVAMDGVPLVWALAIFVQQLDFWWSLGELATLPHHWTLGGFLLLVGLVLSLFLAAALILPSTEIATLASLKDFHEEDGRWALLALATFNGLAIAANRVFWQAGIMSPDVIINLILVALPLAALAGPRKVQIAATLAYGPAIVLAALALSPTY
jgi:hypothetical protein